MFDKMVRCIIRTGKAHKWPKPLALTALVLLFCGESLTKWAVSQSDWIGKTAGQLMAALSQRREEDARNRQAGRRNVPGPGVFRLSHRPLSRAAVFLSVCMAFTMIPMPAFAASVFVAVTGIDNLPRTGTAGTDLILTGTIKAKPFTDADQAAKDQEAVDNAITEIGEGTYNISQKNGQNEKALKRALMEKTARKAGKATVKEIQILYVEYAAAGTPENPDGNAGAFTFKAKISRGSVKNIWTDEIGGIIVPDEYLLKKPVIITGSLPDGTVGTEYSVKLGAESDTEVTWTLEGSLPEGLKLSEYGEINGTPKAAGQSYFKAIVDNGSAQGAAAKNYIITVNAAAGETEHTITAAAGARGTISPSGVVTVANGGSQQFSITAASGYYLSRLLVDGTSVGRLAAYTFSNVTGDHTIEAEFAHGSLGPGTDDDRGGSSSGGGGSSSNGSSSSTLTTSTNTAAAGDGGSVTTTTTTHSSGKTTTVTTEVKKDAAGTVTGSGTTVTTDHITAQSGQGNANVTVYPDGSAINSAAKAAGAGRGAAGARSSVADAGSGTVHTIQAGDTLNRISRQYGCKVEDLLALNPGVDIYNLQIGNNINLAVR